jgi:2,3-dihydroxybenzoate decarboxylase
MPKNHEVIATEEAFCTPEIYRRTKELASQAGIPRSLKLLAKTVFGQSKQSAYLRESLLDLGDGRLNHMQEQGVDFQVISLTSPGVQALPADMASALAREANDILAEAVAKHPDRFAGLTAIYPLDVEGSVKEIERGASKLGMKGIIINSHTHGLYLDHPQFRDILAAAEAFSMPIYLHPREPSPGMEQPFIDYGLFFAGWGFAAETGLHAMRLIMSGRLDEFPDLKIILGHLGEGLPYWLRRIDNRYKLQASLGNANPIQNLPSYYFTRNFWITTSGMEDPAALRLCLENVSHDRIMFAGDFPYEDPRGSAEMVKTTVSDAALLSKIFSTTARDIFNLNREQEA